MRYRPGTYNVGLAWTELETEIREEKYEQNTLKEKKHA